MSNDFETAKAAQDFLIASIPEAKEALVTGPCVVRKMALEDWKRAVITEMCTRLGSFPDAFPPLDIRELGNSEMPGVKMRRLSYTSEEGLKTPAYYVLPEGASGSLPAVVAIAGHGYGNREIVGLLPDGSPRGDADPGYEKDFALALCRKGFAVIVP